MLYVVGGNGFSWSLGMGGYVYVRDWVARERALLVGLLCAESIFRRWEVIRSLLSIYMLWSHSLS